MLIYLIHILYFNMLHLYIIIHLIYTYMHKLHILIYIPTCICDIYILGIYKLKSQAERRVNSVFLSLWSGVGVEAGAEDEGLHRRDPSRLHRRPWQCCRAPVEMQTVEQGGVSYICSSLYVLIFVTLCTDHLVKLKKPDGWMKSGSGFFKSSRAKPSVWAAPPSPGVT